MKKLVLFAMALISVATVNAAGLSDHSVGVLVGGMNGFTYKGFINDNLALQADLAFGLTASPMTVKYDGVKYDDEGTYSMWDFSVNPNLLYQMDLDKGFAFFAGGGLSLGMGKEFMYKYEGVGVSINNADLCGKFGLNALVGAEYKFDDVPLSLGLEFRPGYGCAFRQDIEGGDRISYADSYFDWKLAAALRYYL